ncbi:MAG TPA: tetratricopeptide repeat protein [Bradyrhizobium sp.]|nr:tetratricopeptide repeat protein [Bradyrhizobium sp.]
MNRHESRDAGQDLRTEEGLADCLGRGHALKREGRIEEAFQAFNRAVELDVDSAEAWKSLAQILADLNRHHEAALSFQHVLKLDPSDADAAYRAGLSLFKTGKKEEALALLDHSNQLRPDQASTLQVRGLALQELARLEEALAEMRRAHALDPARADICNDVGVILLRLRRHEEALGWYDKAVALQPEFKLAHNNRGFVLSRLRRFDEAFAVYAALKAADPGNMEPDWSAALLHLILGNFEAGWAGREARWKVPSLPIASYNFPQAMWLGNEPIAGKTILIYQDEGLGDVIQFVRYVPMVAALGARIILLVDGPLVPLLSKLPEVAECIPRSNHRSVTFDTHCAISSLPLAFGTRLETVPADVPYLPPPDEAGIGAWEQRLGRHDRLRVGFVWSGNRKHMDNGNRALPLRALFPLLDCDAQFVSLQKETSAEDQATLRERPDIVDLTIHLTDFTETAALMSCLDLIITVDTSMAHLAGALARPTLIMLQHMPDWRWLLDRDDCPWYPTARLFRQTEPGNFVDVVGRVRHELVARVARWSRAKSLELVGLGTELKQQGRIEEAFRALDRAAALDVESAAAWKPLAQLYADIGRLQEASLSFQHVLKLDPSDADAAYQAGLLLLRSEKFEGALALLSIAKELRPDHAPTLQTRALALALQNPARLEEAAAEMAGAHALDPPNADICNSMGVFLRKLGRPEEALIWFDKALDQRPEFFAASNKKVSALVDLGRCDEALAICFEVMEAAPDNAEAEFNAGFLLLLKGNFEAGWARREARWRMPPGRAPTKYSFSQPPWLGKEPVAGKTILIHQDEGLGDTIQFARYVPMLAALGARVVLIADGRLVPLLSKLPDVVACIPGEGTVTLAFDLHCGISSLPLAFGTTLDTIPAHVPYLPAPAAARVQAWEQRLGPHHRLRVGLVWSGNPQHGDDHKRSIPLRALSPLLGLDASFVSLQKDPRPTDRTTLSGQTGIVDLTVHLTDFVETAALVSCLDLVITVDTSIAHLAGALACPTWIMLPHVPDWRWLLDREDSPWYPNAKLFRQDESCDYTPVIERVRAELSRRIAAWSQKAAES